MPNAWILVTDDLQLSWVEVSKDFQVRSTLTKKHEEMRSNLYFQVGNSNLEGPFLSDRFPLNTDEQTFVQLLTQTIRGLDVTPIGELPDEQREGYLIFHAPNDKDYQAARVKDWDDGTITIFVNGGWLVPSEIEPKLSPSVRQYVEIDVGTVLLVTVTPSSAQEKTMVNLCLYDPLYLRGYCYLLERIANIHRETARTVSVKLAEYGKLLGDVQQEFSAISPSINADRDQLICELAWSGSGKKLKTALEVIASYPAAARQKGIPEEIGIAYDRVKQIIRQTRPAVKGGKKG